MTFDPRTLFRIVAITEAVTWAGLLVGMYFKWIAASTEIGVKVFGPIHGIVVLAYLVTALYVSRSFRWDVRTLLLAVIASVPPFATVAFGIWADRRALLQSAGSSSKEAVLVITDQRARGPACSRGAGPPAGRERPPATWCCTVTGRLIPR